MNSTTNSDHIEVADYESIDGAMADADCDASAAEVQGIICGLIAGGYQDDSHAWIQSLEEMVNEGHQFPPQAQTVLRELFAWTAREMSQQESLAPVLLPDDNYPAVDRLEALIDWSQGFLLGFGLQSGNTPVDNAEVNEALSDLAEICHLELSAEEDEDTQQALMVLIEHIKVAVQVIHWETIAHNTAHMTSNRTTKPTLH